MLCTAANTSSPSFSNHGNIEHSCDVLSGALCSQVFNQLLYWHSKLWGQVNQVTSANVKTMKLVETSKHEAELAVNVSFEQLQETLEEQKGALLSELESIAITQTTSLNPQKEQLEKIQQNISHYSEVTSHILHTHSDHEVVAMGGLIPTELKANNKLICGKYVPLTKPVWVHSGRCTNGYSCEGTFDVWLCV